MYGAVLKSPNGAILLSAQGAKCVTDYGPGGGWTPPPDLFQQRAAYHPCSGVAPIISIARTTETDLPTFGQEGDTELDWVNASLNWIGAASSESSMPQPDWRDPANRYLVQTWTGQVTMPAATWYYRRTEKFHKHTNVLIYVLTEQNTGSGWTTIYTMMLADDGTLTTSGTDIGFTDWAWNGDGPIVTQQPPECVGYDSAPGLRFDSAMAIIRVARGEPGRLPEGAETVDPNATGHTGATVGAEIEAARASAALFAELDGLVRNRVPFEDWPERVRRLSEAAAFAPVEEPGEAA